MSSGLLVVVTGYLLRHPVPGNVWAFLHYLVGLHGLGHRVVYVEESGWPQSCYEPATGRYSDDPAAGLSLAAHALAGTGAEDVALLYVDRDSGRTWGGERADVARLVRDADLLLDVGGASWLPEFDAARCRVLVDMDPLFTQAGVFAGGRLDTYDRCFSYGTRLGSPGCTVPDAGVAWKPTVPPVVPDLWDLPAPPADGPFTTVANWTAYGGVEVDGRWYGQKDIEFDRLHDVPARAGIPVELAVSGMPEGAATRFGAGGWRVSTHAAAGTSLSSYRDLISRSRGEFSAAKHAYVASRSGWISDRTVCYLAAGRPAVVQDTGPVLGVPLGQGLVPFRTPDDAVDRLREVASERDHARAARELARDVFAADVVLPRLLDLAAAEDAGSRTDERSSGGGEEVAACGSS